MKLQRMNMAIISSAMQGRQACTVLLVTSDKSTCTDASGATFLAWAMAVPSKSEVEFLDGSFQDDWGWQCSWRVRGLSILLSWVANAEIISAMVILRLVSSLLKKFMDVWHAMFVVLNVNYAPWYFGRVEFCHWRRLCKWVRASLIARRRLDMTQISESSK